MSKEERIENPWAVYYYSRLRPSGIGLIIKESNSLFIANTEKSSLISSEVDRWNPYLVKRFRTPEQAVEHYLERIGQHHEFNKEMYRLSKAFPKEFRKIRRERIKNLCNILNARANSLFSQSSSK